MSLGIEAGSQAILITTDLEDEDAGDVFVTGPDFPERLDGLHEGVYAFQGEHILFTVGGYPYYGAWRALLCQAVLGINIEALWANPSTFAGQPFVELLEFSDNEGAIGPRTSRKLWQDFANYVDRIPELLPDEWKESRITRAQFLELFQQFQYGFEIASQDGFLIFE